MIKNLQTFWFVFCLYARQSFYHKSGALALIFTWGFRMGLTIILYGAIYALIGRSAVKNITFDVAVSGMLFFAFFSIFGTRMLNRLINNEYKAGGLEIWFTKPLPYVLLKLAEAVGTNVPAIIGLGVSSIVYWLCAHGDFTIDHAALRLLCGAILFLQGLIISVFIYGLVGLSAIFLTESKPIWFIVDKLIMVFGGIYIPIGFFPHGFRLLGETLPTGAATYASQTLYPDFFANLPRFALTQIVWLVVLGYSLFAVNRLAHKRLTVNGG